MSPAPSFSLISATVAALLALVTLWHYRRKHRAQEFAASQAFYALCEQVIRTGSPSDLTTRLADALPTVFPGASAQLYLFNGSSRCLERVLDEDHPEPVVIPLAGASESVAHAAATCFDSRSPVHVPDAKRSPLVRISFSTQLTRSAFLAPLRAKDELLGVLEIDNHVRVGYFSAEDQIAVQHLANQVAAALKLQQQQAMRQQLFQGEKLAATGQLISGVAKELREPLENLSRLAESLNAHQSPDHQDALAGVGAAITPADAARTLATQARRAAEIVSRLVSFGQQPEQDLPTHLDLVTLLTGITKLREPEWEAHGLQVENRIPAGPVTILGIQRQLEQVFLTLLIYGEQQASRSIHKTLAVKTSLLAGRALVEISFPDPDADSIDLRAPKNIKAGIAEDIAANIVPSPETISWDVCQSIVRSHDGELRLNTRAGNAQIEIDLPALDKQAQTATSITAMPARPLTLMLIDSDQGSAQQLTLLLGQAGSGSGVHRVVPVPAEEALDLAQRLRFDAVFWAIRHGRSGLGEFRDRLSGAIDCFVLVADAYDAELAASMEKNGGFLLARPVHEAALNRILSQISARQPIA